MDKAFSGSADDLIAFCQSRPNLERMARELTLRRYSAAPQVFTELLWLLVADALCEGAGQMVRDNLEELEKQKRMVKS